MFRTKRARRIAVAGIAVATLTLGTTPLASAHNAPFIAPQTAATEWEEWRVLQLVNEERAKAGIAPLRMQYTAHRYARSHAKAMADNGSLWHDMGRYEHSLPDNYRRYGENVAYHGSVEDAHRLLMQSPPHRANILNPNFTFGGMGIRHANGYVFVSQNFWADR